jgi:single-strand DNA-binding protein
VPVRAPQGASRPSGRPPARSTAAAVPSAERSTGPDAVPARNEVLLVGRVSGEVAERELPSGDLLVSFRVVVDRAPPKRHVPEGVRAPTVDALACVAWTAALRRTARGLSPGDVVEVEGALRQRYWRAGAGLGSRTEVEVASLRRVARS